MEGLNWLCAFGPTSRRFSLRQLFRRRRDGASGATQQQRDTGSWRALFTPQRLSGAREQRVTVPWRVPLTQQHLTRLLDGFIPNDMDDKWLVRVLPPDTSDSSAPVNRATVWFLRSWTGFMVAELAVEIFNNATSSAADGAGSDKADAVADKKHHVPAGRITTLTMTQVRPEGDDVDAVKESVRGVCRWVLGIELLPEEPVEGQDAVAEQREA